MSDDLEGTREGLRQSFREQHATLREIIEGLDAEALNWKPADETNSLAVLYTHMLGAEDSLLAAALGEAVDRDRDAEFRISVPDADALLRRIDEVEANTLARIDRLTAEDLGTVRKRAGDRLGREKLGSWWVLHALTHNGEHLGQALLTKQLYEQQS